MWRINHDFREGKAVFKRGQLIRKKPTWPNFESMVSSGTLVYVEDEKNKLEEKINGDHI